MDPCRIARTDGSSRMSALEQAAAIPGSSASSMTNCENWAAIRALRGLLDVDHQRRGPQPLEIDLGDYRVLRPEVRADLAVRNARALGDRPHGDPRSTALPAADRPWHGAPAARSRRRDGCGRRRTAGIRRQPFESRPNRSASATAKSWSPVLSEYVLSTVQFTMPPVSAPTMMSASVWASWAGGDLAAGNAFLDEFEERVVHREATLNAVPGGGQHLRDHLAIGVTGNPAPGLSRCRRIPRSTSPESARRPDRIRRREG